MNEKLTAVFEKSPQGYIGYVEELPGANTQGATLLHKRRVFRDFLAREGAPFSC